MKNIYSIVAALAVLAGCKAPVSADNAAGPANNDTATIQVQLSLTRLDCGSIDVKDFSKSFSDKQVYPHGSKELTDSCYLITHKGQHLLWDTGLPLTVNETTRPTDTDMKPSLKTTVVGQLNTLGLKPGNIDVVGISHMHFDHTGQAAQFPSARLVIGKDDFEKAAGKDDPFGPWRGQGKKVTAQNADIDIFGDGSVIALFLPGHTPGHHALLVKLASGPVLLSGDLYHGTEAREKRGVPPFNTDRAQTLASMDKFEALAKRLKAKVIIQHEPADIPKLPAFPAAAR